MKIINPKPCPPPKTLMDELLEVFAEMAADEYVARCRRRAEGHEQRKTIRARRRRRQP